MLIEYPPPFLNCQGKFIPFGAFSTPKGMFLKAVLNEIFV